MPTIHCRLLWHTQSHSVTVHCHMPYVLVWGHFNASEEPVILRQHEIWKAIQCTLLPMWLSNFISLQVREETQVKPAFWGQVVKYQRTPLFLVMTLNNCWLEIVHIPTTLHLSSHKLTVLLEMQNGAKPLPISHLFSLLVFLQSLFILCICPGLYSQ